MKILVGIPVLYHPEICYRAILSVIEEADVLIIDNGSDDDMKRMLKPLNVKIIINQYNIYVNPAWNQILEYFLASNYDTLVIMNSDLIMKQGWASRLTNEFSCIPGEVVIDTIVTEGTPGVFIHLTKEWARMVYLIPSTIKVWFGDLWIYSILRNAGINTVVRAGLHGEHYQNGSRTILCVPGISELIEQDKIEWAKLESVHNLC